MCLAICAVETWSLGWILSLRPVWCSPAEHRFVHATEARGRASDAIRQESETGWREMQRSVRKKSPYPGDTSDMYLAPEAGQAFDRPRPR
jgi:hypothetical protein